MIERWRSDASTAEWRNARRERRLRQRRLPHGLREDIAKIRRDDLAGSILDDVFEAVHVLAEKEQGLVTVRGELGLHRAVLPVLERRILRELNADLAFRAHVRHAIGRRLRTEHVVRTDPAAVTSVPHLESAAPQASNGTLRLRSSIGLGTASYLESEPEEWCHHVVSRVLALHEVEEVDLTAERQTISIYAVGAGAGGIARVVAALEPTIRIQVEEYDSVLPETTELPCVVGSRAEPARRRKYNAIVMVLPTPGVGSAVNLRRIYRRELRSDFDLSAMGERKWTVNVEGQLHDVKELLEDDGAVFVLAPAAVRSGDRYTPAPRLLESVLQSASRAGLNVVERHSVIEVEPVRQPFVGSNRPSRWSLLLQHRDDNA